MKNNSNSRIQTNNGIGRVTFMCSFVAKFIVIGLTIFPLIGFSQLKRISAEIPVKPKLVLSDSIQSLTLINRSITPEFVRFHSDSLQVAFYRKNFNVKAVLLDSLVADTTLRALGELLFESTRYDVVIPLERNLYRQLSYSQTPEPLSWKEVEDICNQYNTDALVVLENSAISIQTEYSGGSFREAKIKNEYRMHWRLYYPKSQIILADVIHSENFDWSNADYDLYNLFQGLPRVYDATIFTALQASIRFSDLIAPRWEKERRFYYAVRKSEIDLSEKFIENNDWEGALNNWLKYVDSGPKSRRSKVMLNVGLAYEMLGDTKEAAVWVNKSLRTTYREVTNSYYKSLLKRIVQADKK